MRLKNKGIVITGASRGLGAALARKLSAEGARLVLVARNAEPLDRIVEELRRGGGEAHGLAADIGDKQAIHRLSGAAHGLLGTIEVLVHNASTLGPTPLRPLLDTECEDFGAVLETNLVGPFRLTKAIAGGMVLRGEGQVIHISSDAAVEAYPTWGAYSVAKAGLDHLNRIFAAELQASGVRFLSVDPGEMDTRMHAEAIPDADRSTLASPDEVAAQIASLLADPSIESGQRVIAATAGRIS
ncbi:MAG: SDR family oxidoreductase [Myxococcota bacterium]